MADTQTADAPTSYRDPYWTQLASNVSDKLGLPEGLLPAIITRGERTNADQVSSAGARTPFQIIPATRDAALEKWGVDAYLSPENAAEVAGRLLKDSLQRNGGDVPRAVAEYHGGTDTSNWGPKTAAYVQRVTGAPLSAPAPAPAADQSTFQRILAQHQAQQATNSIASIFAAYQGGQMTPDERTQFESDVRAGKIMLPQGASLQPAGGQGDAAAQAAAGGTVPSGVLQAFARGEMTPQEMADFEHDVRSGQLQLPPGMDASALFGAPDQPQGVLDKLARIPSAVHEAITGAQRRTPTIDALPDWSQMPEFNGFSAADLKTAIGTLSAGQQEIPQIVKANFPNVQVSADEKGNPILTSGVDGKQYAVGPGFRLSDLARAPGQIASFVLANEVVPGSGARGLLANSVREAAVGAVGQAGIEASQAATGGSFDADTILPAAALGALGPAVGAGLRAAATPAKALLARVRGAGAPATPLSVSDGAAEMAAPTQGGAPAAAAPPPAAAGVPAAPDAAAASPTVQDVAQTAREAAGGAKGATQDLAAMVAPDAKTSAAAERLGIQDYLQPDHVTTSDAYRQTVGILKSMSPVSELSMAERQGLEQVGQRAASLIDEIGGSTDLSQLDANVKRGLTGVHADLSGQEERLYQQVRDAIPPRTPAPADNTIAFLNRRAADLGGAENLTPMERQVLSKLSPIEQDGGAAKQPTYTLLDDVRKDVGAAARQAGPFSDADTGLAKQLYARLTSDQQAVADATGQRYTFLAAKYATQLRKGIEDDMTSLFGKHLQGSVVPELGGAMKAAASGDASRLVGLLKAIPDNLKQQVVATGMQTVFRNAASRGELNFTGYAKWYGGLLRNRQAYAAVMHNLPQPARKQLSDLYRVSRGISESLQTRIGTGRLTEVVKNAISAPDTLAQRLFEVAKHAGKGLAADALGGHGAGLAMGLFSALKGNAKPNAVKAIDELLTSPEYLQLARAAGTPAEAKAVHALAVSKSFNKFAAAVGRVPALSNRERFILAALQGAQTKNGGKP